MVGRLLVMFLALAAAKESKGTSAFTCTHQLFLCSSGETSDHGDSHSLSKNILGGDHGHVEGGWLDTDQFMLTHAIDSRRRLSSISSPVGSLNHTNVTLADVGITPKHKSERRGSGPMLVRGASVTAGGRHLDAISKVVNHDKSEVNRSSSLRKQGS